MCRSISLETGKTTLKTLLKLTFESLEVGMEQTVADVSPAWSLVCVNHTKSKVKTSVFPFLPWKLSKNDILDRRMQEHIYKMEQWKTIMFKRLYEALHRVQ